jgi:DNA-binding MarR family transcriptional regulator
LFDEKRIEPPMAFVARLIIDHLPSTGPQAIPANQFALILLLEGMEKGMTIGEIRDVLGLGQSTTSALVDATEKAGYVARWRNWADGRVVRVSLTPKGQRVRMRARWRHR